jgi:hypothetical protein
MLVSVGIYNVGTFDVAESGVKLPNIYDLHFIFSLMNWQMFTLLQRRNKWSYGAALLSVLLHNGGSCKAAP